MAILIDADELSESSKLDCDICFAACFAASGPAGPTFASERADATIRVCLIASGGLDPLAC